jgi:hypothetical protein
LKKNMQTSSTHVMAAHDFQCQTPSKHCCSVTTD